MKVKPWMVGVGVLGGMAGVVVIYEIVQSKKTAVVPVSPELPVGVSQGVQTAAQVPTLAVTRPAYVSGIAIFGRSYPTGAVVNMAPGTAAVSLAAGQSITLVLAPGCKWVGIVAGNSSNTNVAVGQVNFGNDLTSPVSLPMHSLVGANVMVAAWIDTKGTKQYTYVQFPLVVAPKALHL